MHSWLKEVPVDAENIAVAFPAIVHRLPTIHTENEDRLLQHVSFTGTSPSKHSASRTVRTLDQPRPPAAASNHMGNVHYIKGNEQLFIYWRVLQGGQVLELQLHSLAQSQLAKEPTEISRLRKPNVAGQRLNLLQRSQTDLTRPVQFVFPSTILPTVFFHDVAYGRETIQITLLLASGVLYQLSLVVPDVFTPGHKISHDFARHRVIEAIANPNSGNIPVFLHSVSPQTSLIACKNGSTISVKTMADDHEEKEITTKDFLAQVKNSGITRLISTAISAIGSPLKTESSEFESALSQSVAIASCTFRETRLAFSLCRDRKLRIYDVNQGTCIKTVPVNSSVVPSYSVPISQQSTDTEEQQPLPPSPKSYLRVVPCEHQNGSTSVKVMIYVRSDPDPFFALVMFVMSASGSIRNAYMVHRKSCDRFAEAGGNVGEELVDFQVVEQSSQGDGFSTRMKDTAHDSAFKPFRLWTLWDRQGQSAMRYSEINIPTDFDINSVYISASERWHSVVMKKKEFIDTAHFQAERVLRPHVSISDIFLEYIFQPGRFSTHALEQGISKYEATTSESHNPFQSRQTGGARRKETRSELQDHATRLIAKHIKMETFPQTGAQLVDEHRNQVLNEWRRFTTICLQAQQYCDKPLGLSISSTTGMVSITKQNAFSTVRVCDQAEVIYHHSVGDFPLGELSLIPDGSISEIYPDIAHMCLNKDIFHILRAGEYLREQMSLESHVSVDQELQSTVTAPISMAIESFAGEFYDKQIRSCLGAQKRSRLSNILSACDDARQSFMDLIQMIQFPYPGGLKDDGQNSTIEGIPQFAMQPLVTTKSTTVLADALITSSIQQAAYARYDIARSVFLLLVTISSALESKRHILDAPYVLSKCMKVLHSSTLLSWMTKQSLRSDEMAARMAKPGQGPSDALLQDDGFIHRFADMHLLPNFMGSPFQQSDIPPAAINFISYSLVHVLLHKHYHVSLTDEHLHSAMTSTTKTVADPHGKYASSQQPQFVLQHGIMSFMQKLGIFESINSTSGRTGAAHLTLAIVFEACGVPQSLLKEYLKFLDKLPAVEYLHGKQSLQSGELEKARQSFQRAGAGLVTRQSAFDSDRMFSCVLRRDILSQGLCGYYKHVADLFEASGSHGNVVAMCRLALNAVPIEENQKYAELVRVLHHKLFTSSLELGNYEEAFMAIMGNPDEETKRDNIRHFVALLCERDQVRRLCSQFTFVGLDDEVEQTLMFKARTGDVLVAPNYYKVLYSWHIYRGDYRNACMVMYQHGRRLGAVTAGNVSFLEIASEQGRSYLAAMNALKLVDKAYAWIFMPREGGAGGEGPATKRLKVAPRERSENGDFALLSNGASASTSKDVDIIQLEDIQKDYLLAIAKLNLSKIYSELGQMAGAIEASDAVTLYTQADRFDDAFTLAAAHGLNFQPIFDRLIARCLSFEQTTTLQRSADGDYLAVDDDAAIWDGTAADYAWRLVRKYLEMHDDEKAQYRAGILEKMLSLDRNARLWPWLTHFYKEHHSDDLIRICLKYERVMDAARFALKQIQRATNIKTETAPRWLPYSLIDQLLCALQELQDNPPTSNGEEEEEEEDWEREENVETAKEQKRVHSLMDQLQTELDRYFDRVRTETRKMREQTVKGSGQGGFARMEAMIMA